MATAADRLFTEYSTVGRACQWCHYGPTTVCRASLLRPCLADDPVVEVGQAGVDAGVGPTAAADAP